MADLSVSIDLGATSDGGPFGPDEIDLQSRRLREEFLQLDVNEVRIARDGPPLDLTKAVDANLLGAILVSLSDPTVLVAVMETVKSWIGRSQRRTARLEIDGDILDVTGISSRDQTRLIDQWIARHSKARN